MDIGGSEGLVEVVAATDGLVLSVGDVLLDGHQQDTPVSPRFDMVYLLDGRGWYYLIYLRDINNGDDNSCLPEYFLAACEMVCHVANHPTHMLCSGLVRIQVTGLAAMREHPVPAKIVC